MCMLVCVLPSAILFCSLVASRHDRSRCAQARTYFLAATSTTDLDAWLRSLSRCNLTVHNEPSGKYARFYAVSLVMCMCVCVCVSECV